MRLGRDAQLGAGVAPEVGPVGGAVVGQDAFDGDAAVGEPGDRAAQDPDRGGGLLVVVDLDVGDPGVVVDDGVQVGGADQRVADLACAPVRSAVAGPVLVALLAADVAPAAAVGDVAELLDVDVDQRRRGGRARSGGSARR